MSGPGAIVAYSGRDIRRAVVANELDSAFRSSNRRLLLYHAHDGGAWLEWRTSVAALRLRRVSACVEGRVIECFPSVLRVCLLVVRVNVSVDVFCAISHQLHFTWVVLSPRPIEVRRIPTPLYIGRGPKH